MKRYKLLMFKTSYKGSSLVVQWVGLGAFTAVAWVQSLFKELRFRKLQIRPKKKKGVSVMALK